MRTLTILAAILVFGCDSGPKKATIRGTVTLIGQPVDNGVITFTHTSGQSVSAEVRKGQYTVSSLAGTLAVQISAPIVTGKRPEHNGPGAAMVDIITERLPPKYNSETDLSFEANPGDNEKNWTIDLKK